MTYFPIKDLVRAELFTDQLMTNGFMNGIMDTCATTTANNAERLLRASVLNAEANTHFALQSARRDFRKDGTIVGTAKYARYVIRGFSLNLLWRLVERHAQRFAERNGVVDRLDRMQTIGREDSQRMSMATKSSQLFNRAVGRLELSTIVALWKLTLGDLLFSIDHQVESKKSSITLTTTVRTIGLKTFNSCLHPSITASTA